MQSLYNGGAERSLVNLLNELPEDKYEIDLLLFKKEGMFLEQLPPNINLLKTPKVLQQLFAPLNKTGIYFLVKLIGTLVARIFENGRAERTGFRWKHFYSRVLPMFDKEYDLAVSYISGEVLYYVDEKVSAERKIVWIHNDYRTAKHAKKYDYSYLQRMDAIVSISEHCVEILRQEFPEFSDKLYNVPNITSSLVIKNRAEEFVPKEYEGEQNILLSIGRLHYQKGFDIAIEATSVLKRSGVRFKWFVLGDGKEKDKLEELIAKYDVSDCFIFLGTRSNPYPYIKNATAVIQTSRYEGKSVVLDETKILAKPIISTNYPTVNDQITNGVEGIVVDINPHSIAHALQQMLSDPEMRRRVEENLKQNEYGNQNEVEKYIQLFDC